LAKLFTKYPALVENWARKADIIEFTDTPWSPLNGSISESRLALVTTGGVHLKSQPPFDMLDPAGDPSFREIPGDTPAGDLIITHNYYDHADADKDINIVFPIKRLRLLERSGEIGAVNHRHFSFMGHITNNHLDTLVRETAPRVADALTQDKVDAALLTPA